MPKAKVSSKKQDFMRGRAVGLCSLVLSLVFMYTVGNNVRGLTGTTNASLEHNAVNYLAPIFALIAAWISLSWDRRVRLLVAVSLGILLASAVIWVMANGYTI